MNKKVLSWIVVLLASLASTAAAAVWLIAAGLEVDINPAAGLSQSPLIVLAVSAALAVTASLVLVRMTRTTDGTLARESFVSAEAGIV